MTCRVHSATLVNGVPETLGSAHLFGKRAVHIQWTSLVSASGGGGSLVTPFAGKMADRSATKTAYGSESRTGGRSRQAPYGGNASGLASGVYFYRLQTPGFVQTRILLLVS